MPRSLSFYMDILNSMADPVRVIDSNGCVVYQNSAMRSIAGEQIGSKCFVLHEGQSRCANCICRNQVNFLPDVEKELKVGGRIYSVKAALIEEDPLKMVEVFRDITEELHNKSLLLEQHNKIQQDLEFARKIQKGILPDDGVYGGLVEIRSVYEPAELLGGDIFDVIPIDENHVGFYIADVSGHGVTSSMITLFIRQAIQSLGEILKEPCQTLKALYGKYEELGISEDKYITVLYGVYDKSRGLMRFSNAGHNCLPIHINADQHIREVNTKGIPICTFFDDIPCAEVVIPMSKGHRLILYTDGISEARGEDGVLYGDRIMCLVDLHKASPLEVLCKSIYEDRKFYAGGKKEDDLALMAMEIMA